MGDLEVGLDSRAPRVQPSSALRKAPRPRGGRAQGVESGRLAAVEVIRRLMTSWRSRDEAGVGLGESFFPRRYPAPRSGQWAPD